MLQRHSLTKKYVISFIAFFVIKYILITKLQSRQSGGLSINIVIFFLWKNWLVDNVILPCSYWRVQVNDLKKMIFGCIVSYFYAFRKIHDLYISKKRWCQKENSAWSCMANLCLGKFIWIREYTGQISKNTASFQCLLSIVWKHLKGCQAIQLDNGLYKQSLPTTTTKHGRKAR